MTVIRAPRSLLRMDAITIMRISSTVDAEGNEVAGRVKVFDGRGTRSNGTSQEKFLAAARGTRMDQVLSLELGLDVQAGDFETASGVAYEVVSVDQRRLYQRVLMRRES